MKRIIMISRLRFPVLFIVYYLLVAQGCFAQDCKVQAANKPSVWVRGTDDYFDFSHYTQKPAKWDVSKMKLQAVKAERWIKSLLTGFTGARMLHYNSYVLDYEVSDKGTSNDIIFYNITGVKKFYSTRTMCFAYYCYDNSHVIQTEGESGSNIKVVFNNFFISGITRDAGVYTVNGTPVFGIIKMKRSESRIDYYEQRVQDNATAIMYTANDYIFLRNSDQPVFIPVTRKEYLGQMLKDVAAYSISQTKQMTEMYNLNRKQFEDEMKGYKAMDKSYTAEKEAKRRKWFEEDQEKLNKVISKIKPDSDAATAVIQQYLQKPAGWLSQGYSNFYTFSSYTALSVKQYFESMDKSFLPDGEEGTTYEIVSVNPAYFNKKVAADVPQLITVHLQNGTYGHMIKVANLVKQPGALAPLEAIVNHGK
ncbi:MAG TPA: hypothetical protein PLB49_12750 [Chitinophagaceae bacterium]|nr:hypothetical protein [Chitinophagaceae bacterium]HPH32719.1 hypothetical protein [Chitinophagaceae bacterium]